MAIRTAEIHTRIEPNLKMRAEQIFASTGHTASDAIEQFYAWTVLHNKTPMRLRQKRVAIPDENTMTRQELEQMVTEAEKQIHNGKHSTLDDVQKEFEQEYGF